MRKLAAAVVAALCLVSTACMSLEQAISLEKNLSGTATIAMNMNMESMADMLTGLKLSMTGNTAAPSAADLEQGRKEFLAQMWSSELNPEKIKTEMASTFPAGLKLLDSSVKQDGLKIAINMKVGFDDATKLASIKLDPAALGGASPIPTPTDAPLLGIKVVEEAGTVLITTPMPKEIADLKGNLDQLKAEPAVQAMVETMLKGLKTTFRITTPFEVIEHNAHKREGNTLVWEFNIGSLEALMKQLSTENLRVRYKK